MYNPLPELVTIKDSGIHGLGLFATEDIPEGKMLGQIHFFVNGNIVRTPLGAFGNHSNNPNCMKFWDSLVDGAGWYIRTNRDIKAGEELTWIYTLYKIS